MSYESADVPSRTPSPSPCPSRSESPGPECENAALKATMATPCNIDTMNRTLTLSPTPTSSTRANRCAHHLNLRRPIPNSYWVSPHMVACEYPWNPNHASQQHLDHLLAAGVRTFIDLTEPHELRPYYPSGLRAACVRANLVDECEGDEPESDADAEAEQTRAKLARFGSDIAYHRFPIPDRCLPPTLALLTRILALLAHCEAHGRIAAVHCRGGIGRTGLVVGCWLVQSGRARDGREALAFIAEEWASVEKRVRYPVSPETGAQCEFVRGFRGSA